MLANFLVDSGYIPIDYKTHNTEKRYKDWLKRIQSLSYIFQEDLKKLNDDFNSNFLIKKGKCPIILELYFQGEISLETITILVDLIDVLVYWKERFGKDSSNSIFLDAVNKIYKYLSFLSYDKSKYVALVRQRWGVNQHD